MAMTKRVGSLIEHVDGNGDPAPIYSGIPEFNPQPPPGQNATLGERNDPRVHPRQPRREP